MNIPLKEILRDSEIRQVRKQLAKLASQARKAGTPLTELEKTNLLQQLVAEKVGRDTEPHTRREGSV